MIHVQLINKVGLFMVFNATFNNISVISWRSISIGGGNRRKPPTCRKSLTNYHIMLYEYTSPWIGFEPTTLVMIGTDCIGNWKSNCHTITTTTAPLIYTIIYDNQLTVELVLSFISLPELPEQGHVSSNYANDFLDLNITLERVWPEPVCSLQINVSLW